MSKRLPTVQRATELILTIGYTIERGHPVGALMNRAFDIQRLLSDGFIFKVAEEIRDNIVEHREETYEIGAMLCQSISSYLRAYRARQNEVEAFDFSAFEKERRESLVKSIDLEADMMDAINKEIAKHEGDSAKHLWEQWKKVEVRKFELEDKQDYIGLYGRNLLKAIYLELRNFTSSSLKHYFPEEVRQLAALIDQPIEAEKSYQLSNESKPTRQFTEGIFANDCSLLEDIPMFVGEGVRVYKPVAQILQSTRIPFTKSDGRTDGYFDGSEFILTYKEAYQKGREYFEQEYKRHLNPLLITKEQKHKLKRLYFETGYEFFGSQKAQSPKGWLYARCQCPLRIDNKCINDIGYNVGILEAAEDFMRDTEEFPFNLRGKYPTPERVEPFLKPTESQPMVIIDNSQPRRENSGIEEYDSVTRRREEEFDNTVNEKFEVGKRMIERELNRSHNPSQIISREIAKLRRLYDENSSKYEQNPSPKLHHFRKIYDELLRGYKPYLAIDIEVYGIANDWLHYSAVKSQIRLWEWLTAMQASDKNQTNFENYFNTSGQDNTTSTESQEDLKDKIKGQIEEVAPDVFVSKNDYDAFVKMLEAFFSGQEVASEKKRIIQTKNRKKTKITSLLHALYKDLKSAGTLKHDTEYLELARAIDCLQDESDVYKAITRTR